MSLRDLTAKYQPIVAAVAILVIIAAVVYIARQSGGGGAQVAVTIGGKAYFYDLSKHELFPDDNARLAPFTTADGAQAVRAVVFACGDCAVEADRRIGHLQRYTDDALQKLRAAGADVTPALLNEVSQTGLEVAMPPDGDGDPQWIGMNHPNAMAVMERHLTACGNAAMTECRP